MAADGRTRSPVQNPQSKIERVALIGNGPRAETRAEAVRAAEGAGLAEHLPEATAAGVIQRQEAAFDVGFLCGTPGRRVERAEAALRQGRHLFLEWPPAASAAKAERLAARAEEAGAEVGVSRPLRFHPLFDAVPEGARAQLVTARARWASGGGPCQRQALTDALDLCGVLAGSRGGAAGVRRLDAQAAPPSSDGASGGGADARFGAVAAGLRFHSGTYATLDLRRARSDGDDESAPPQRRLYAAGPAFELNADLDDPEGTAREKLLRQETRAFLRALAAGRPAPVSLLDARPAMRLTERIMQRLR